MVDTVYDATDDFVAHNACEVLHSYKQKHICQQFQNECTDCIIASSITTLYCIKLDPLNSEFDLITPK
jgi:hypothetical protein